MVAVWGFVLVFNEAFVDSATKGIVGAGTRLVTFAPAASPQDRDRPPGSIFLGMTSFSFQRREIITGTFACLCFLSHKSLVDLERGEYCSSMGRRLARRGLSGPPKTLESGSWESGPLLSQPP